MRRWHPVGSGYQPVPGDWVLFDGHVEVVTRYSAGVLSTIGGDSMPDFSVNAHEFPAPLAAQGITGFVNNGMLATTGRPPLARAAGAGPGTAPPAPPPAAVRQARPPHSPARPAEAQPGVAAIPGTSADAPAAAAAQAIPAAGSAAIPGMPGSGPPSPALQAGLPPAQQPHARAAGAAAGPTGKRQPRQAGPPGGIRCRCRRGAAQHPRRAQRRLRRPSPRRPGRSRQRRPPPVVRWAPWVRLLSLGWRWSATLPTRPRHQAPHRPSRRVRKRPSSTRSRPGRSPPSMRTGYRGRHDRPGHRRVRLGPERAGHEGPQPVRHQGHRPGLQLTRCPPRNTRTGSQ